MRAIHHRALTLLLILRLPAIATAAASSKPNIVIVLTDDLDFTLGGWQASTLAKTRHLIGKEGTILTNWFAQTPVCCPSRAELLTGQMFHNLWGPSQRGGCMHVDVKDSSESPFYKDKYFAQYFQQLNYTVGIFGKHLNQYNPSSFIPDGVDEMLLNGGGVYLNPSFTHATREASPPRNVHFNNCTDFECYTTAVVGNASLAWIQRHLEAENTNNNRKPFFSLISVKAPHILDGPGFPITTPAPWYKDTPIQEKLAPRTPHYNQSCLDHHWLVRQQDPLTQEQGYHIDLLYQSRLRSLLSVDDLVENVVAMLESRGVLENTYIVFTSDNGFRLGQFRMPCCKLNPYEEDIRLPFLIRGPGIAKDVTRKDVVGTPVDLMPTLLGFAAGSGNDKNVPPTMDGHNWASQLMQTPDLSAGPRRILLIEYKSLGSVVRYQHLVDTQNHTFLELRILNDNAQEGFTNMKYVQFRELDDWNATGPPLERELFDLSQDPYEMHNRINEVSPNFLRNLDFIVNKMMRCRRKSCREAEKRMVSFYEDIAYEESTRIEVEVG